eukprot:4227493-Pyramimonas_sp.AAC.1
MKELGLTCGLLTHCPRWGHVVRRVAMNFDDNAIMQDIQVQDQPVGCNCHAPLPSGVTNIRAR